MKHCNRARHFGHTVVLVLTIPAVLIFAAAATASPIADGRFDPNEGYTLGRNVNFAVEESSTLVTGGQIWTYQDAVTGNVTVAFLQPKTLVDNTYGANSIGWGASAPSGKNHNFKDLLESDKAQFQFTDGNGNVVLDVTLDYISAESETGPWYSQGVTGNDGAVDVGSADDVLSYGSSLDYNFKAPRNYVLPVDSPATDDLYTPNASYPNWIYDVIYEMEVSGDLFTAHGFGDVAIPIVHDSPNKIARNKVYPEIDGPITPPVTPPPTPETQHVPEPATITMTLLAIGAIVGVVRKRRRQKA